MMINYNILYYRQVSSLIKFFFFFILFLQAHVDVHLTSPLFWPYGKNMPPLALQIRIVTLLALIRHSCALSSLCASCHMRISNDICARVKLSYGAVVIICLSTLYRMFREPNLQKKRDRISNIRSMKAR